MRCLNTMKEIGTSSASTTVSEARSMAFGSQLLHSAEARARLTWQHLCVTVSTVKGESHTLLHDLTGYAEPGTITAIMGPSGSGKTTLLDALAGRLALNATMGGEIKLNGAKAKLSYGIAAYLTQEDTLIGTLTVRETILFSAQLRLPDKMPLKEKKAMVESTITEMGLLECADTPIGNWHMRGLSGGERRRVSIALEILLRPPLLFLDEPTSGLDSASAFFVMQALMNLAGDGHTVIASIHQPSSEVFELFGNLFLLCGGKAIYFGDAASACDYFASVGYPCQPHRNPADHFLRVINTDFDRVRISLKCPSRIKDMEFADPLNKTTAAEAVEILIKAYECSELSINSYTRVHEISMLKSEKLHAIGSLSSTWMQAFTLTRRSSLNMARDAAYYWLRVIVYLALALSLGTIYFKLGTNYNSILARGSCILYIFGFLTFMSIGGFPCFVEDMKVFQRDRLNGHYRIVAFVIANTLSSAPFLLLIALSCGIILYYMVQFHPGFSHLAYFIVGLFTCLMAVESLMMLVCTFVPNFLMGLIVGAAIQAYFMLTAGFFRLLNDLPKPVWRYPVSYLGFHTYVVQGMYQNDFRGLMFENESPNLPKLSGESILLSRDIDLRRSKWWNLAILMGMVLGYRLLFLVVITLSEIMQPWIRAWWAKYKLRKSIKQQVALQQRSVIPVSSPSCD